MDGVKAWPATAPRRHFYAWSILALSLAVISLVGLAIAAQLKRGEHGITGYKVIAEYPHDPKAFCQGFVVADGQMYEGTGKYGESTLRKIDLETGRILSVVPLDSAYFGEGVTILDGQIYQLTWQNRIGLVYDQKTMKRVNTFRYTGEGWGLTNDGKRLILSDGTSMLRFIDPKTFNVVKRLRVRGTSGAVDKLNELEYVKGEILANIWYADRIARISPESGEILGWIDLSGLYPEKLRASREDVLNGIAFDEASERLFVTGKNWPKVYEIELVTGK